MAIIERGVWSAEQQERIRKVFEKMPVEVYCSTPDYEHLLFPDLAQLMWNGDFESTCKLVKALEDQGLKLSKIDCWVKAGAEETVSHSSPYVTFKRVPSRDRATLKLGFEYKNGGHKPEYSGTLGREVCEALGLDPKEVRSLDLHIGVKEAATLTVSGFLKDEDGRLAPVLRKYELKPKEEEQCLEPPWK